MVAIKKQVIKAYILLESLISLSLFAMITSLLLVTIGQIRQQQQVDYQEQEVLNVAKMALQAGKTSLEVNGVHIRLQKDGERWTVFHGSTEVLHAEKD